MDEKLEANQLRTKKIQDTVLYFIDKNELSIGEVACPTIIGARRWLALDRQDYWNVPSFGGPTFDSVKNQTQLLLVELENGLFQVLLPFVDASNRTTLEYKNGQLKLIFDGTLPGEEEEETMALAIAEGADGMALINSVMKTMAALTGTFRLREEKARPDFMNYLGWCTWDAFYHTVDQDKVQDSLDSFKQKGIKLGFMILDDGGLDTTEDYLNSFHANSEKFPEGFLGVSRLAKETYGLKFFGLWHAFQGYWTGLLPEGELAKKYGIIENSNVIRPWITPHKWERLCLVDPANTEAFFDDFYASLASEGIDFLKVDGQSATELFTAGKLGRADTMQALQSAMQTAAQKHFGAANVISCMSNGSDVMFNMKLGNVWRNSQDYFPEKAADAQGYHLYCNAYNAILSTTFSWPDWDMFQSHTPEASYHAVARAISGGPVYVCDKPWKQDSKLIQALCFADGRIPSFDRPALPSRDVLMENCYLNAKLLKITNVCKHVGQIAVFNCYKKGGTIHGTISPSDIPEFKDGTFAVCAIKPLDTKMEPLVSILSYDASLAVSLDTMEVANYVISPVETYDSTIFVAPFGLAEKFSSAATFQAEGTLTYTFFDGGTALFYCSERPASVFADGNLVDYIYESALLRVKLQRKSTLRLSFENVK